MEHFPYKLCHLPSADVVAASCAVYFCHMVGHVLLMMQNIAMTPTKFIGGVWHPLPTRLCLVLIISPLIFVDYYFTWSPPPPSCNKLDDWLKFSWLIRVISVSSSPINWAKFLASPVNRKRGPKKIIVHGPYTVTCMAMTSYCIHIPTDHSSATRHVGGGQCHPSTSILRSYRHKTGSKGRLRKPASRMKKPKRRESRKEPNNGRGENWEHELLRTKIFWPWDSKTTKQHSSAAVLQIMSLRNEPNNGRGENWEHELFENKDLLAMGLKDNQTALLCNGIADCEPPQRENLQLLRCCRKPLCDKSSNNCIHWHPDGSNAEHNLSVSTWESQSPVKEHKRASSQQCTDTIPNLEKKCPSWKLITTQPTNPCFDRCQTAETPCPCCQFCAAHVAGLQTLPNSSADNSCLLLWMYCSYAICDCLVSPLISSVEEQWYAHLPHLMQPPPDFSPYPQTAQESHKIAPMLKLVKWWQNGLLLLPAHKEHESVRCYITSHKNETNMSSMSDQITKQHHKLLHHNNKTY